MRSELRSMRSNPRCRERTDHDLDNVEAETIVAFVALWLAVAVHYLSLDVSKMRRQRIDALKPGRANLT